MKLDVFYTAYQKKLHMGLLTDEGGRIRFFEDESFFCNHLDVWPLLDGDKKAEAYVNSVQVPALFWDYLPTGYHAEILHKISNNDVLSIPVLKKLAMCSKKAIGAIEFEPSLPIHSEEKTVDLDLTEDDIQNGRNLGKLYKLSAGVNGHTPKITVSVSAGKKEIYETKDDAAFDEWIIKLPSTSKRPDDGAAEYVYSQMAKEAGLKVPECRLFESKKCAGYFGTKRFDRDGKNKIHTLSAGVLMNKYYLDGRIYLADYVDLMHKIAPENVQDFLKILLFNIKTGNDDMRGTNISFCLKEDNRWTLAPAYDLVPFSLENDYMPKMLKSGYDKNEEDGKFYDLCELAGFDYSKVPEMIEQAEDALGDYQRLMREYLF